MRVTVDRDVPVEQWPLSRLLITASRLVEHDIAVDLRPYHLTHASFGVLALVQGGSMSQRQLAAATRVEEQTISQTVDRLERMGMITREKDPADRRRSLITVTESGRAAFRHATRQRHGDGRRRCVATVGQNRLYEVTEPLPAGWTTDLLWTEGAIFDPATCELAADASLATIVAEADCVHSITNTKQTQETFPVVTFYKYVCEDYASVPANTTNGDTPGQANAVGQPDQVASANATLGGEWPFGSNAIPNPHGAFPGCELADGWNFTLATDQGFSTNTTTTGNTSSGMVQIELTQAQLDAAESGPNQLWVKENYRSGEGYGFAAVKCHTDHLHRDNLEWIDLSGQNYTENPVCVAFNVAPEDPTKTVQVTKTWEGGTPTEEQKAAFSVTITPSGDSPEVTCDYDTVMAGDCVATIGEDEGYEVIETLPAGWTTDTKWVDGAMFNSFCQEVETDLSFSTVVQTCDCTAQYREQLRWPAGLRGQLRRWMG